MWTHERCTWHSCYSFFPDCHLIDQVHGIRWSLGQVTGNNPARVQASFTMVQETRQSPHNVRGKRYECATRTQLQVRVCVLQLSIAVLLTACTAAVAVKVDTVAVSHHSNHQMTSLAQFDPHVTSVGAGLSALSAGKPECNAVVQCLNHSVCAQCLAALNSTTRSHSWDEWKGMGGDAWRENDKGIFRTLQSNSSCAANDSLIFLPPALLDLSQPHCTELFGMFADPCMIAENGCFENATCRGCLNDIYNGASDTTSTALNSSNCMASNDQLRQLAGARDNFVCRAFPRCTFFKKQCGFDPECESCLTLLSEGDGQEAAKQCNASMAPATFNGINSAVLRVR